jgi:predicted lipoprotein with Yx(FWY)xxD motif
MGLAVAAVALTAAGCSNGSGSPSGSAPAAPTVSAQPTGLGTIIVDGRGRTVYDFANDKTSASTCIGACAANWPPVPAPASLPASLPGITGKLGTTIRTGGARQLTIAGHPVYTFAGDSAPGQTNGQGKVLDGGLWTVVSPAGAPEANPAGATSSPAPKPPATPPATHHRATASPAPPAPSTAHPTTAPNPPGDNGGDHDADNNGGPDDGDGDI